MAQIEQQFRIAEIDVAKNPTDEKIVGLFRFENTGSNKQSPVLLIIAEIQSTLYVYERLLDVINSTAEQARHLMSGVDQDPIGRFEKMVQRLNEAVAEFEATEATPLSWNRINIFVMELSKGQMCLTGIGSLMNLFLQKQDDGTFRSFDLFGSLEQPVPLDPKKPFGALICGDIMPGDLFIVGSSNLERLRSELRIKERLSTLPPITAALEIKQDLEKRGIPDHFVAAVIASHEVKVSEPVAAVPVVPPQRSTASVEKLRASEAETAQHLSPALGPITSGGMLTGIIDKAKGTVANVGNMIKERRFNTRSADPMAMASLRGMNAGFGSIFTKRRKLTIGVLVAVAVLAIAGILWYQHAQKQAAELAAWNATFDGATDNSNRAESDLIYGNETRAQSEIDTAEKAIASLPTNTPDRKTKITGLQGSLDTLKQKLKKVVTDENVTELTSLPPTAADGSLVAPVLSKGAAYVVDEADSQILKIDLTSKDVTRVPLPSGTAPIVSATEGTTSILFATKDDKLLALNKTDGTLQAMKWTHTQSSSTVAVVLYASKLYSLDPSQNQIWRTTNASGGFGAESAYIKAANTSLTGAVGLAIDSNVYVLKNDGTLLRFLSGGQEGFGLAAVDPPLQAASSIFTDANSTYIYITDPAQKRVLMFDKDGNLKAQIESSQFSVPRNVEVDEANKQMLLIDGNRLLLV
ncbi:MAG: hypothetical protein WA001_00505, partial [Patescibacteria group bacterium]